MADKISTRKNLIRALIQKDKDMIKAALGIEKPKKFLVLNHIDGKTYFRDKTSLGFYGREMKAKEVEDMIQGLKVDFSLTIIHVNYKARK